MNKELAELENADWASLTYEEKNRILFLRQKKTLDMFLERGALSQAQHDKSLHDLIEKMGIQAEVESDAKQVYSRRHCFHRREQPIHPGSEGSEDCRRICHPAVH